MLDMNRVLTHLLGDAAARPRSERTEVRSAFGPVEHVVPGPAGKDPVKASNEANLLEKVIPFATGALATGVAGRLLGGKQFRKVAGTVLQVGAVAAIGGVAYKAYRNYQQGRPVIPESVSSNISGVSKPFAGESGQQAFNAWVPLGPQAQDRAKLLLGSMVASAASDGNLDGVEYGHIRAQLVKQGWSEEEQLFLSQMLMKPPSVEELAAAATSFEQRVEVYVAARLAIELDVPSEHDWLDRLAKALHLEADLKTHLDAIGPERTAAAA